MALPTFCRLAVPRCLGFLVIDFACASPAQVSYICMSEIMLKSYDTLAVLESLILVFDSGMSSQDRLFAETCHCSYGDTRATSC